MTRLTGLGVLVCLLLVGLIAAQLMVDIRPKEPLVESRPQASVTLPEAGPSISGGGNSVTSVIEARPLFSASRRPVAKSQPTFSVNMEVKPFHRRLSGVVIEPSMRAAMFAGDDKGRGILVKEGEPIEGWFLETVTPVGVTLRAAGASQVIELAKTKNDTEGRAAAKPVVPSFISPSLLRDR
jgi:hypothetical protein